MTAGQLSERATSLLEETSKRLEAELRLRRVAADDPSLAQTRAKREQRHSTRHRFSDAADSFRRHPSRLYRDRHDLKIGGVCAGFARYFGVETWVVRMGALTGLIFLPGIVFPAYWIAYFIMDKQEGPGPHDDSRRGKRRARRAAMRETRDTVAEPFSKRRSLRHTAADLTQVELRLRRLESFVTSGRYELHKELNKIEREGGAHDIA